MKKIILILLILLSSTLVLAQSPYTLDWTFKTKMSVTDIESADLNFDGIEEILAVSLDGHLYVINSTGSSLFRHYNNCQIYTILIEDLEGDGKPEILLGGCRHLEVLNSVGTLIWKNHVGNEIKNIRVEDLEGDKKKEIIVTTYDAASRSSKLVVIDITGSKKWMKSYKNTKIGGFEIKDIDHNDVKEILVGTKTFNAYNASGENVLTYSVDKQITHIDVTPEREILLGTKNQLITISNLPEVIKTFDTESSVWDIESDERYHYIASDSLYKLSHLTDKLRFRLQTEEDFTKVILQDLDGDNSPELVGATDKILITTIDSLKLFSHEPYRSLNDIHVTDIENDGFFEVIAGSADHNVYFIKSTTKHKYNVVSEKFYDKAVEQYNQKKYDNALKFLKEAQQRLPDEVKYQELEKTIHGIQDLNKNRTYAEKLLREAEILSDQGAFDEARKRADIALKFFTDQNDGGKIAQTMDVINSMNLKIPTQEITHKKVETVKQNQWLLPIFFIVILLAIFSYHVIKKMT